WYPVLNAAAPLTDGLCYWLSLCLGIVFLLSFFQGILSAYPQIPLCSQFGRGFV
ncbi:hypothetical protein H0E87_014461, partial [Populus deltoides]